jgi:hypothetical protein
VVALHSPQEQTFSGTTLEEALAWCLVWLMAPGLGIGPFLTSDSDAPRSSIRSAGRVPLHFGARQRLAAGKGDFPRRPILAAPDAIGSSRPMQSVSEVQATAHGEPDPFPQRWDPSARV